MLVTRRLRLAPFGPGELLRLAAGVSPAWLRAPEDWLASPDAPPAALLARHADRCAGTPGAERWLLRAILAGDGDMLGHIGFHDVPQPMSVALADPTFEGDVPVPRGRAVEVGYTVFAAHRRRGVATEAATALVDWALGTGEIDGVLATTADGNTASQRVLAHAGMERIGRCRDDDGTPELVWWRGTAGPPAVR